MSKRKAGIPAKAERVFREELQILGWAAEQLRTRRKGHRQQEQIAALPAKYLPSAVGASIGVGRRVVKELMHGFEHWVGSRQT